jgi:hypothetical protein
MPFGGHEKQGAALNLNDDALDQAFDAGGGGGKDGAKLDFLFADVMVDPFFGSGLPRFPHADSVVPNGGGAVELDFGGVISKPSSYSSYTAPSLTGSVSPCYALLLQELFFSVASFDCASPC